MLTENGNNLNDNDSSNSSSSQNQNLSFMSSSPPPLPMPLPSNFQIVTPVLSKFSPPSQQPPPLPPLPPELASKYALNKTALHLDTIESRQANNYETCSLDSDAGILSTSVNKREQDSESRADRQIKGTSTCSELDVFYMNSSAPHIDTASEVASMSGGDLSGEIYASPILNPANSHSSGSSITPPPPSGSSSFPVLPPLPNYIQNDANSSINNSLLMSTFDTIEQPSNGLLSIDHKNTNDERGGSFIDSKCKN